jgi:galactonate dehydratase
MTRSLAEEVVLLAERFYIGQDPLRREWLWYRCYEGFMCAHPDYIRGSILSAFDTALWDIAGKHFGVAIHQLLGGKIRDKVRAYSYIYDDPARPEHRAIGGWGRLWQTPELNAERGAEMAAEGYTALKFDPIAMAAPWGEPCRPWNLDLQDLRRAEKSVRLLREALGDECDILIGTHGQMTPAAAVRLAKRMEQYDPLWYEEPTPLEDRKAMAYVRSKTSIPIATGERLFSVHDFSAVLNERAADILQPDLGSCGGITQYKKISALAEPDYVQMSPHVWGGPGITAAALQVDATIPNFLIQESISKSDGFFNELIEPAIQWEDGCLVVPDGPGLGVELKEQTLERYRL